MRAFCIPILILAVAVCYTGCRHERVGTVDRETALLSSEGLQLLAAGRYDEGIEKLSMAVERSPEDKTYITNLAFGLYHAGYFDDAVAQFERALKIDPEDPLIYLDYGRCLQTAGRTEEAILKLDRAIELDTGGRNSARILVELSSCHEALGDFDEAAGMLRRAIGALPRAEYYTKLGDLLQEMDDIEGAEKAYESAIEANPRYAPAMNNLGLLLCNEGRKDEGVRLYRMVLEMDPRNEVAHNNLAMELWEMGDAEGAISEIQAAIDIDPTNALLHYHLAMFLKDSGNDADALAELLLTLQLDPAYPDAQEKLREWTGG